jgi:hypothetical protein
MVTSPAERAQMPVADSLRGERPRQHVQIELWGCARAWNRAYINEEIDVHLSQQCDELRDRPCRVAIVKIGVPVIIPSSLLINQGASIPGSG